MHEELFVKKIFYCMVFFISIVFVFNNCNSKGAKMSFEQSENYYKINNSDKIWKNIISKKIYFGHMSVGFNIINGIEDIIKENNLKGLRIIETKNAADFNSPLLAHSKNGVNTNPVSKIDSFADSINNGLGRKADIAFFKFCYVDIVSDTNVPDVFSYYETKMDALIKAYPRVKFVHFTVPLSTYKKRDFKIKVKDITKSIIGRETSKQKDINDNIARNKYNELLFKKYNKKDIFNLAELESAFHDGSRETVTKNGEQYFSMVPDYTYDGGHLNECGRKYIAINLLRYLTSL